MKEIAVTLTGPWKSAKVGQIWIDEKGREHHITAVHPNRFDATCEGNVEAHRPPDHDNEMPPAMVNSSAAYRKAVSAWKLKG